MNKWKTVELGDLVTLASGGSFPIKYQGNAARKYKFFKVSDMNLPKNQKYLVESVNTVDEEVKEKLKSKIHPKNTIVFPKVGAALLTNKRRLLIEPSAFDNNIMGVVPNENVDFEFLYYYMLTVDFRKLSQTGAIPSINNTIVSSLPVDLPTNKLEQQKIAAILSSVDDAIEKTEQIIEQTEKVKKGLMHELLTKGIGHTEFKDSPVGEIPVCWKVIPLNELASKILGGGTPSRKIDEYYNGDIPWLTVKDLGENTQLNATEEYITEKGLKNSAANLIKKGNVIVSTRMAVGKAVLNTVDMAINQDMKGIYLQEDVVSVQYFLYSYLNKSDSILSVATGTTVKGIRLEQLKSLQFAIPSLEEQEQIAKIISNYEEKVEVEKNKLYSLLKIKQGLMQQLLTGKTRVKIDDSEEVTA